MERDFLKNFTLDVGTFTTVRDFFNRHIEKMAVTRTLKRESTSGIADAYDIINNAFSQLETEFKVKNQTDNSKDESI